MAVNWIKRRFAGFTRLVGAGLCLCLGALFGGTVMSMWMDVPEPFDCPEPESAKAWRGWNRQMEAGQTTPPEVRSLRAFEALSKEVEARFGSPPYELLRIEMETWERWERGGSLEEMLPQPRFGETHGDLVEQARRAAALGGPVDPMNLDEILPWYEGSTNAYRCRNILHLAAHENLLLGKSEAFLKDVEALWSLGNACLRQYSLIGYGDTRIAQDWAIGLIHRACDAGLLTADQRTCIRNFMQDYPDADDLSRMLELERWTGQRYLEAVREGKNLAHPYEYYDENTAPKRPRVPFPRQTAKVDALFFDSGMATCQAFARAPYHEILWDSHAFYSESLENLPDIYAVSKLTLSSALHAVSGKAYCDTRRRMLLVRLDVVDFLQKNTEMPASLDVLYGGETPEYAIDPYSGEPLRLVHDEDGWLIYSVGRDGKDDGGESHEDSPEDVSYWQGDIVQALGRTG